MIKQYVMNRKDLMKIISSFDVCIISRLGNDVILNIKEYEEEEIEKILNKTVY